jgi:hypothetical protein
MTATREVRTHLTSVVLKKNSCDFSEFNAIPEKTKQSILMWGTGVKEKLLRIWR